MSGQRWVVHDTGTGWFSIHDRGPLGRGRFEQLATVFSRGRADVVRDALEAAWPLLSAPAEDGDSDRKEATSFAAKP